MKKLLSVLLCLIILVSSCQLVAFADDINPESKAAPVEAGLLGYLQIMEESSAIGYWDETVTRAQFATYLYNIAKNEATLSVDSYYTDVAKDSELEKAVNHLVKIGVLSVGANRLFRPDDVVSFGEACKMLVVLAGYETYANAMGAYPGGYITTAHKLDITLGINSNVDLDRYSAAVMIYNTLHAGVFDIGSITEEGPVFTDKGTETVIEKFYGIYIIEGVVTKKNGADIYSSERAEEGVIAFDSTEFEDLIQDKMYLGYEVKAFVKDNDPKRDSVVYAQPIEGNNVLKIDARDLIKITPTEVKYFDEKGDVETEKLYDASFVKNGSVILDEDEIEKETNITKGFVTLVANKGKSSYNAVLITEYENIIVGLVESSGMKVYDKLDPSISVHLDDKKLAKVDIMMNGKKSNFYYITENDLLSVVRSADGEYVTAIIATDVVKGTVESYETEKEPCITINGVEYRLDATLAKRIAAGTSILGDYVEVLLDATGEVAHIRTSQKEKSQLGYVYDYDEIGTGFTTGAAIAMYTFDNEHKIFNIAEKVSVNGGKKTTNFREVFAALESIDNKGSVKPQIIRYTLNAKGEISGIFTADHSINMSQANYISKVLEEGTYTYRSNLIYPITAICTETKIIQVPTDDFIYSGKDSSGYFKVIDKSSFKSTSSYTFEAYNLSPGSHYTDVVVYKTKRQEKALSSDKMAIVRRVSKTMDANGEETASLEVFANGQGIRVIARPDCIYQDENEGSLKAEAFKEGDFIRYSADAYGNIAFVKRVISPENFTKGDTLVGMIGAYDSKDRITVNYAADKYEGNEMDNGGILSLISFAKEWGGDITLRLPYSRLKPAVIYDGTRREGDRIYLGNIDNIITYRGTDGVDASIVVTSAETGSIKTFYVIN